jgi:hypothetical protein
MDSRVFHRARIQPSAAAASQHDQAMTPELAELCHRQGGVFTPRQALTHGMTPNELRSATRAYAVVSIRQGVLTTADRLVGADVVSRHAMDIAAALLLRNRRPPWPGSLGPAPSLAAGHLSAAVLWNLGGPLPPLVRTRPPARPSDRGFRTERPFEPARKVELVSADRCRRSYRWGVEVCPADLPPERVTRHGMLPTTTRARTAIDLARELPWQEAVTVTDAALHWGTTQSELHAVLDHCASWRGSTQAARVLAFADGRAESPAESVARVIFDMLSLPEPELQVDIYDVSGLIGRVDFLFRGQRTVIEIDGKIKYLSPFGDPGEVLWREKLREDRLREAGYEVVRITWEQLMGDPQLIRARILAAFARAARLSI